MNFIGTYEVTVDQKGRFALPVGLRKQIGEQSNLLVMNRGFDGKINMYPMEAWLKVQQNMEALDEFDEESRKLKELILGTASAVEIDNNGRVLLPPILKRILGEDNRDIVITSNPSMFHIWRADKYYAMMNDTSDQEFSRLAQSVNQKNRSNASK